MLTQVLGEEGSSSSCSDSKWFRRTVLPVTAQGKSEGEVKVAKSARGKTSLEGGTCTAAHTVGSPSAPDAS